MANTGTGSRPTMGTEASRVVANSSQSPNLKVVPRGGSKNGAYVGGKGIRQGIQERLGAKYAPQMPMSAPNAPEAALTQRNVRLVQSAVGNRDFYLKRAYGQVQQ